MCGVQVGCFLAVRHTSSGITLVLNTGACTPSLLKQIRPSWRPIYSLHRACAACIAIGQLVLRLRGASTAVGSLVLAVSINPSLYMVLTAGHVLGTDTERQNLQRVQISARR